LALGANAAGGAINMLSSKPVNKFELNASASYGSGNKQEAGLSIGSRQKKFFISASTFFSKQDSYPLSALYDSSGTVRSEDGNIRENAYARDFNAGIKFGYTPNISDEFSINYLHQSSTKGTPPYAGAE